jgi:hypothetical protein
MITFGELEKYRFGWMTYPIGFIFNDCIIDQTDLTKAMIAKGLPLTEQDLIGVSQYRKKYQSIVLPTPKGQKISEHQQKNLNLISNTTIKLEDNCKLILKNLREASNALLPTDLEIEKCIEFTCIIIPYELKEGIRLHFECDWGDYASGTCSVALQFFDFDNIQECEEEYKKYGL